MPASQSELKRVIATHVQNIERLQEENRKLREEAKRDNRLIASLTSERNHLRAEVERLEAEVQSDLQLLAHLHAECDRLSKRQPRPPPKPQNIELFKRIRNTLYHRFHPDHCTDPIKKYIRQELFKELQEVLKELEQNMK